LQEDSSPARVPLDLNPQDAVTRPAFPYRLQTVDGRARKGNVDVSEDEEDEECLTQKKKSTSYPG